jgi:hypothetical protein
VAGLSPGHRVGDRARVRGANSRWRVDLLLHDPTQAGASVLVARKRGGPENFMHSELLLPLRPCIEICFASRLCLPSPVLQWRLGGERQLRRRGVGLGGAAETSGYCSGDPSTRCTSSASSDSWAWVTCCNCSHPSFCNFTNLY